MLFFENDLHQVDFGAQQQSLQKEGLNGFKSK